MVRASVAAKGIACAERIGFGARCSVGNATTKPPGNRIGANCGGIAACNSN